MRKSAVAALSLTLLCLLPAIASAQVKGVYWTASGLFGPFPIKDLIPSLPKEKARDVTIPVNMWIIDHPKGLVVFDTGNNAAISDGKCKSHWAAGTVRRSSSRARSATTSSTGSSRSSATRRTR